MVNSEPLARGVERSYNCVYVQALPYILRAAIDFEARGNGCLIEQCTFENNAGAAIEVLGLKSPQITNLEIRNSRFIKNN